MMVEILEFIGVAIMMAFTDVCWTMYFIKTEQKQATKAAFWSSMIVVCGSIVTLAFISNKIYLIASVIGAFIGTYATIKFQNRE